MNNIVSTDPLADMLTRIRNAISVRKNEVVLPHSKLKQSVAELLRDSGFLRAVQVIDAVVGKNLKITISNNGENSRITEVVRLSKPGRRSYTSAADIPVVMRGRGIVVISTSKGVMTGDQAKKQGVGGELICRIY